jgi:predicted DNA-binding protein (UPF0251 family)
MLPPAAYFKPQGARLCQLEEIVLTVDEFEALRLADLEGLYHEGAAQRMKVSRPTFGRIVSGARRKVARALVGSLTLKIEGGNVNLPGGPRPGCPRCHSSHPRSERKKKQGGCPSCCRRTNGRGSGVPSSGG